MADEQSPQLLQEEKTPWWEHLMWAMSVGPKNYLPYMAEQEAAKRKERQLAAQRVMPKPMSEYEQGRLGIEQEKLDILKQPKGVEYTPEQLKVDKENLRRGEIEELLSIREKNKVLPTEHKVAEPDVREPSDEELDYFKLRTKPEKPATAPQEMSKKKWELWQRKMRGEKLTPTEEEFIRKLSLLDILGVEQGTPDEQSTPAPTAIPTGEPIPTVEEVMQEMGWDRNKATQFLKENYGK
jgi:hypothetical protein